MHHELTVAQVFFYALLPPIIFHAGFTMRRKNFFINTGRNPPS